MKNITFESTCTDVPNTPCTHVIHQLYMRSDGMLIDSVTNEEIPKEKYEKINSILRPTEAGIELYSWEIQEEKEEEKKEETPDH